MICSNHFYIYNTEIENRNYNVIKYEYSTSKKNICKQNKISYEHQIGFMNIISVNEENGNSKNLLLIKLNNDVNDEIKAIEEAN